MSALSVKQPSFAKRLSVALNSPQALGKLTTYLVSSGSPLYSGRAFDTYGANRSDPFAITGDDIVAVSMLSMEVKAKTKSGITPEAAIRLEERSVEVTALLMTLPDACQLHEPDADQVDKFLLDEKSPGRQLLALVREILSDEEGATTKWVASRKLVGRKRPHLIPIKDSRAVKKLGDADDWWKAWWEALRFGSENVARLSALRSAANANHLSLLRVADIVVWMG